MDAKSKSTTFWSRCRNQYKKEVLVRVAQHFCCPWKQYSTKVARERRQNITDSWKIIGLPSKEEGGFFIRDSVHFMHIKVQRKRLVKSQSNSGWIATSSSNSTFQSSNNWTWEDAEGIWGDSAVSILLEMFWLQKMMVNPLRINVGLKKRVGKNRIRTETLL